MIKKMLLGSTAAALLVAMTASHAAAQTSAMSPAYAARSVSPAVVDQLAILDLIARMNQSIDADDYAAYSRFYLEDGVIDSGFGPPTTGRDAIVASLNQSAPFITDKRHVASNVVINGTGRTASAVYYLTVFERKAGLTIAGTAMIIDELRRTPSGWLVVRHTTRMDPATVKAMSAAVAAPRR